jgi:hypothetical protein
VVSDAPVDDEVGASGDFENPQKILEVTIGESSRSAPVVTSEVLIGVGQGRAGSRGAR